MKRLLLLCLALIPAGLFAQNRATGRLLDGNTSAPEAGAVVQLLEGESVRAYAISDSLGVFSLEGKAIQRGIPYTLVIENLGRKSIRRELTMDSATVDLGDIPLEDDLQALESSKVVSARKLIKMDVDKVTYDVAEDVDSKASTVLEMLRKVPMVTVDGQDNITVNGSSSFKVYVDGKPNEMFSSNPSKIFKSMPASAVKNIEVITNPGAKYDAEGTGGVLNLITARGSDGKSAIPDGANGTVTAGVNTQGSVDGGLFVNARKGKFSVGLNSNAGLQFNRGISVTSVQKASGMEITEQVKDPMNQRSPWTFSNLNASFEADTLNLISLSAGFHYWGVRSAGRTLTDALNDGTPLYNYEAASSSRGAYMGFNAGLDYQHTFPASKQQMLTLSYRYSLDPNKTNSHSAYENLTGIEMLSRNVNANQRGSDHTFQADFTTPVVNEKHTLSSGVKFIYRHNRSHDVNVFYDGSDFQTIVREDEDRYHHYNYIAAAYSEYAGSFWKLGLKAGLRYEYTFQRVVKTDEPPYNIHYGNFVPNGSIQFNIGPTQNIGLAYNLRIRRPGITQLDPFVNRSSATTISYGNSSLKPENSHSIKMEYHYFSQKVVLNAGVGYRFGKGGIASYNFYGEDPDDPSKMILHATYGNIVDSQAAGLNYFISWNPWKDTRIFSSAEGAYQWFESKVLGQSNKGFNGNLMVGVQQTIPWDIRLSANFFGMTRRYSLQGWDGGFCALVAGVSKSFLDDRLSITLRGITNLNKGKARFRSYSSGENFSLSTDVRVPLRQLAFELSWSFGKQNVQVKKTHRSITNDDVMEADRGSTSTATSSMQSGM